MQGDEVVQGLMLLFQRLRNEAERKASTPAMRLLDDLLLLMDADTGSSESARLESAAERMDMAFDPNGGTVLSRLVRDFESEFLSFEIDALHARKLRKFLLEAVVKGTREPMMHSLLTYRSNNKIWDHARY